MSLHIWRATNVNKDQTASYASGHTMEQGSKLTKKRTIDHSVGTYQVTKKVPFSYYHSSLCGTKVTDVITQKTS
jgi:hypothetical protein